MRCRHLWPSYVRAVVLVVMWTAAAVACNRGGGPPGPTGTLDCCSAPRAFAGAHGEYSEMHIGAFEWGDCTTPGGRCVVSDAFKVVTPDKALSVSPGERIVVRNPVAGHGIDYAGLHVTDVQGLEPTHNADEGWLMWPFGPGTDRALTPDGNSIRFDAPDASGRYVVNVYLAYGGAGRATGRPNAYYGLLIYVR